MREIPSLSPAIRDKLFHSFFLGVFALLLYQLWRILSPFLAAILGAVVLTILFYPLHLRLVRWTPRATPSAQALTSTVGVTVASIVPLIILGWLLCIEAESIAPYLSSWSQTLW